MARTIEDLQAPAKSWGQDLKNYEDVKRRSLDERLLDRPAPRITAGQVKLQERMFDPTLQRYRDCAIELEQSVLDEGERVAHLNRARDIQIMREQPYDIIRHDTKVEALAPGMDPAHCGRSPARGARPHVPQTVVTYKLISNLPFDVHHWAEPSRRPRAQERSPPKPRLVPAHNVKDFHIITNRYLTGHRERTKRDQQLTLLDAAHKYRVRNRFDPVTQQFTDPRHEERARAASDAHDVDFAMRSHSQLPPSFQGREAVGYDVVTHEATDGVLLHTHDRLAVERKARYQNRHVVERNWHIQDILASHSPARCHVQGV